MAVPLRDTFKASPAKRLRVLLFDVNEILGRFKPGRIVCKWTAGEMGVVSADCILVAAHSALIAREEQQRFSLAELPEIVVPDFAALARTFGA